MLTFLIVLIVMVIALSLDFGFMKKDRQTRVTVFYCTACTAALFVIALTCFDKIAGL